jgi:Zn-dependent protease with chaperone function
MNRNLLSIAALAAAATSASGQTSSESLRQTYDALHRVTSIKHHISKANIHVCSERRLTFGFHYVSINEGVAPEVRAIWVAAFAMNSSPTVIYVDPRGPGKHAGLQVNDAILSVNGSVWPEQAREQAAFLKVLSDAISDQPRLIVKVRRAEDEHTLELTGELTCDIRIKLTRSEKSNAFAVGNTISFESGIGRLLSNDGELAFVIAHEMAHVILKHFPDKSGSISRAQMEMDADDLGMKLFLAAGYNPDDAVSAIRKLDTANRGPITRMLGIYGPYLPTENRVEFLYSLAEQAADAKPSIEVPPNR